MTRLLRMFGRAWVSLAIAVILLAYGATWYLHGWAALMDMLAPSNVWAYLVAVVTFLPGILAILWADRRDKERRP